MKSFFALVTSLVTCSLLAAPALAQLPNQPIFAPPSGDHGVYATQNQLFGPNDQDLAKAYDNFSLSSDYLIDGFNWSGIYAEPFPATRSDTDFVVEIWGVDAGNNNYADVGSGPLLTFNFEGGTTAGTGGPDLTVTALGHTSPATDNTPGGGEAFSYSGSVPPIPLAAGDYWISILANQTFSNQVEVDPEWQWHLGTGPGDSFTAYDRTLDPAGTPLAGILQEGDKDLAFQITGQLVPEPNSALLAALGMLSLGLIRRQR